ncbi:DUF362 domain-containing protein [Rosettibacter firmus]|uniref:DUF362 domain-containing protein n=1 Tax=Rosettibacter firmus TaxID=3111522 RepID=UPI00336BEB4D
MKNHKGFTRRDFIKTVGITSTGLMLTQLYPKKLFAFPSFKMFDYKAKVAITRANNYERNFIKQKVQYLFEQLDGIKDLFYNGKRVAIKINLTGGSGSAYSSRLKGTDIREAMWTHPEVMRAVIELIIDSGVNPKDIFIVEALWDDSSFNNFGYKDIKDNLGVNFINLNKPEPYSDFAELPVGDNKFYYSSFKSNRILSEVDLFVSIPKLKHHFEAGYTGAIKNHVGIVPKQLYELPNDRSRRGALHQEGGPSNTHLPKSISDLLIARPIHLSVIDGIKNAIGGEGVWNPTFEPAEYNVLIAGKDAVATDSVGAFVMGRDPSKSKLQLPAGGECDNYLYMLNQKGYGINNLNEIDIVGDGKDLITSLKEEVNISLPDEYQLMQNFPNPFNPSTRIGFYIPKNEFVDLRVYDITGREIKKIINKEISAGYHEIVFDADNLSSGIYFYRITTQNFYDAKKMILQK